MTDLKPWQKVLLLENYSYLRKKLYLPALIDDLIVYRVIDPVYRQTFMKFNKYSSVDWIIKHITKKGQSQQIYNAFKSFLKDEVPDVFEVLADKEASMKTGELLANFILFLLNYVTQFVILFDICKCCR